MCTELDSALLQCQLIVSEMQHFVQQIQYYINFEVQRHIHCIDTSSLTLTTSCQPSCVFHCITAAFTVINIVTGKSVLFEV